MGGSINSRNIKTSCIDREESFMTYVRSVT